MKAKIMIVEDHEPIRNELKILLSKYGYEIIALDRFDTVVEDCLREDVDLILLDINLPFYDGYYVCRTIRLRWMQFFIMGFICRFMPQQITVCSCIK